VLPAWLIVVPALATVVAIDLGAHRYAKRRAARWQGDSPVSADRLLVLFAALFLLLVGALIVQAAGHSPVAAWVAFGGAFAVLIVGAVWLSAARAGFADRRQAADE
jgi:hypothetical membrane protein